MLPVAVQFIVAMLAYALNERMARKGEYLREENRVLKDALHAATGKSRIPLTNEQRRRLATKGRALTPAEREECCQIVRPSTILAWFRQLVARKYDAERFHQGLGGRLIKPSVSPSNDNEMVGPIQCRSRLGGLLRYYHR